MAAAAASLLLLQCVVTMLAGAATADAQYSAQTFADLQNAARADVGVAPLAWDDTLAGYAQRYAGERKGDCKLVHSDGPYGESIFWGNKGGNWTASDAVAVWVQEKQYYNCSDGSCAAGKICSHYTQIVWANTTRVGCAAVACDGNLGTFILCEYDPRGNVPGVRPYAGCGQFNRSGDVCTQSGGHAFRWWVDLIPSFE
uniref:Putative pathogenesis-related protein PR1-RK2 isoform 6 n=1 Tax=Triticum aestivum TaxID=4565 RepID=A0A1S5XVU6_WHEAT|nr:putative pathogenesis-related protein PR1-RK2 isoform 6 [Triticum aestivum]AQQ72824.1 putative pathogenesis-related protein PR1-RK2 isoform 6 [Triticum aestivum]